jgi:hypothetical protein
MKNEIKEWQWRYFWSSNQETYVWAFVNNLPNGEWILQSKDGIILQSWIWKDGKYMGQKDTNS